MQVSSYSQKVNIVYGYPNPLTSEFELTLQNSKTQEKSAMTNFTITQEQISCYDVYLKSEDRCVGTREKYLRDVKNFACFLDDGPLNKESVIAWRDTLVNKQYAPVTINSMIAAVNSFLRFVQRDDCRVRFLKIQRKLFREKSRELTRAEYEHLVDTAYSMGKERLALLMETICASGIRVSEVKYITVDAAKKSKTEIRLKGKVRCILLTKKLCHKLLKYAKKQKIVAGEIFLTSNGKSLSRGQIWAEMKKVCKMAGIEETKVFPHNLRHLFATVFYKVCKDVVKLADVLGHSSIDTTRLYLITTSSEHERQLEKLCLVCL